MSIPYSPLRYPGGKNCIFPFVSNILKLNGLTGCPYAEPYAGGAGLALRLLFEEYTSNIIINDLDPLIYSFWKSVLTQTDDFCDWIEKTPVTVATWKKCKQIVQAPHRHKTLSIATATFFLNRTNVSGIIDGGIIGGLDQTGKYKIDARYNHAALIARIQKIGRYRARIALSNIDGISFIRKLNNRKSDVFIYLDPPYFEKGSRLYMNAYKAKDHENLSRYIPKLKKPWMISYDNNKFILDLYSRYEKVAYRLSHSTSNKIGNEIVIFSDGIDSHQSIQLLQDAAGVA